MYDIDELRAISDKFENHLSYCLLFQYQSYVHGCGYQSIDCLIINKKKEYN